MKKFFMILAAAAVIMGMGACEDSKNPTPGGNETENPGDNQKPNGPVIAIDGDFTDWDAVTKVSEDGRVYVCVEPNETLNSIRNLKAVSDGELIFMYLEVKTDHIMVTDLGGPTDSNTGITDAEGNVYQPGALYIDIDSDNDPSTGLYPHTIYYDEAVPEEDGYAWNNFKMDNALQLYFFRKTTGEVQMTWSQLNPAFVPGIDFQDGYPELNGEESYSDSNVEYYFWHTDWDNLTVTYNNFKAVAAEDWTKLEFAIDPYTLWVNGVAGQEISEIAFGVWYDEDSTELGYGGNPSGCIPGDRVPATLVLN